MKTRHTRRAWLRFALSLLLVVSGATAVVAGTVTPAQASAPNFQIPFPCGEIWNASTYSDHGAIDWNAYPGDDTGRRVIASAAGTASPYYEPIGGYQVIIDHGSGWKTVYAHLQQNGRANGTVAMGDTIGYVGSTGSGVTGAHLHWEQKLNGVKQVPLVADGSAINPATHPASTAYTSNNCGPISAPDADRDGVPDSIDHCPNQAGHGSPSGCPDIDNDGFHNAVDECDDIPGVSYQQGCRQPMATMRGDYNGDGNEDVASFYVYPERGSAMSLFVWDGNGSGTLSSPRLAYYDASGWGSDRVIPAGSGDFNEDGRTDIAIFYRYPDTVVRSITWYSQPDGSFAGGITSVDTAMEGANLIPVGTGDYNGNGTIDLASLYRYPERGNALSLIVWEGDGAGGFAAGAVKWYNATGWDGHLIIPIGSGEFFTDGRTDITVFYDYGDGVTRMLTWYGRADGTFYDPAVTFYASSGWNGRHLIPAGVGDFDGDGKDDVASFYGYPERGNAIGLFIWKSNGGGTFQGPQLSWYTSTGWWWLALIPAGVSDLDGNGRDELSMFFDYGASTVRLFTWWPDTSGNTGEPTIQYYATDMAGAHLRP